MATPESYRPDDSGSSPAPPVLPERGPDRFQFSLKQLLAFMFVSALAAVGMRYLLVMTNQWETNVVNATLVGLVIGGLMYFFLRYPFVLLKGGRLSRRWKQIEQHRRELEAWRKDRMQSRGEQETTDVPPAE